MGSSDRDNPAQARATHLYESLRGEVSLYVSKVPEIWLQKFVLVGGVIVFLVGKKDDLSNIQQGRTIVAGATFVIPLLSVLLDAKILEYGLHARAISRFIRQKFPDPPVLGEWEASLWGDAGDPEVLALVRRRSQVTVVVTAAPTAALILLSGFAMNEIYPHQRGWIAATLVLAMSYVILALVVWYFVWPEKPRSGSASG